MDTTFFTDLLTVNSTISLLVASGLILLSCVTAMMTAAMINGVQSMSVALRRPSKLAILPAKSAPQSAPMFNDAHIKSIDLSDTRSLACTDAPAGLENPTCHPNRIAPAHMITVTAIGSQVLCNAARDALSTSSYKERKKRKKKKKMC